jgi:hypothetical protein
MMTQSWMLARPNGRPGSKTAACVAILGILLVPGYLFAVQQGPGDDDVVTFTRDVAPILQQNCEACHQPGSIGPMSLRTYDEVRPWAPLVRDRVERRAMPPWPIDRTVGIQSFKNDMSLTEGEIATIVSWVEAGAPMGDPAHMPPPIEWPDYSNMWQLESVLGGPPEIVVTTEDWTVPAQGLDQWFDSDVAIEGVTGERWIRAVEVRPSNPDAAYVFHHGNSSLIQGNESGDGSSLIAAAVGKMYDILPPDAGIRLLPGAVVRTGFHYFPVGFEVPNATIDIGIYLYPEDQAPQFQTRGARTYHADETATSLRGDWTKVSAVDAGGVRAVDIFIPPHGRQMLKGNWVVQEPTRIHSIRGHLHLRGVYQMVEAIYPDGRHEVISKLNWDHRWHTDFLFDDHAMPLLPKGTVLTLTSYFDNSADNPHNPDPDQLVVFGRRSADEMSHIWIGTTSFSQEDFDRLVAERERLLREREQIAQNEE